MEVLWPEQPDVTRYWPSKPARNTPSTRTVRCSPWATCVCNSQSGAGCAAAGDWAPRRPAVRPMHSKQKTWNLYRIVCLPRLVWEFNEVRTTAIDYPPMKTSRASRTLSNADGLISFGCFVKAYDRSPA